MNKAAASASMHSVQGYAWTAACSRVAVSSAAGVAYQTLRLQQPSYLCPAQFQLTIVPANSPASHMGPSIHADTWTRVNSRARHHAHHNSQADDSQC